MAAAGVITGVRLAQLACAVPSSVVTNERFVGAFGEEQMQKFEKMVGVKERRMTSDAETTSVLAVCAAKRLGDVKNVDAVLFVSQTPDRRLPATACVIQHELNISSNCIAYDINLGCSGFVYGVFGAASMLKMEGVRRVLLCGGDTISKITDENDSSSAPLFGDAGFAMILEADDSAPEIRYAFKTDGAGCHTIACDYGGHLAMDGMDVFNFTINEVPDLIKAEMAAAKLTAESVDYLVLHQANKFVLKQVAMMTGFSMKKVPISMDRYGNTSSASIPLTLCDLASRDQGVKKMVMSGFGVGLSWGTLIMDFDLSVCKTDIISGGGAINEYLEAA